ncbi:hypothetical protein PS025_24555, partial [Shigella sonnei]|nr:hypothetical protein [Shigella sonnei]
GQILPENPGRRGIRGLKHGEGVGGGDADLTAEIPHLESVVNVLHCRKEVLVAGSGGARAQDFVPDYDGRYLGRR